MLFTHVSVVTLLLPCSLNASIVVTEINSVYTTSAQSFGTLHVFNINFDVSSFDEDVSLRKNVSKGFIPPSSPDFDMMGFVWEYDTSNIRNLSITTFGEFAYTRLSEAQLPEYFQINEGNTNPFGVGITFLVNSGEGEIGINLMGGHTTDGEYFPIEMNTGLVEISNVPEPSILAIASLGLSGLLIRKRLS